MCDSDIETSNILDRLTYRLFHTRSGTDEVQADRPADVTPNCTLFAVTVNICPNKKMNGRLWKKYTHDKQRVILCKLEACFRRKTPTIELVAIEYEMCPVLHQIHFHALYKCPKPYGSEIETYWARVADSTEGLKNKTKAWRHLDVQQVYDKNGWLIYITKTHKRDP